MGSQACTAALTDQPALMVPSDGDKKGRPQEFPGGQQMPVGRLPVVSAALLWGAGILIGTILSIVFQATQHSRGISEAELGALGASFVLGRALVIATGPLWVYRADPRWVTAGSLLLCVVALVSIPYFVPRGALPYAWFVVGLTSGCFTTPAYTALGNATDPLRAYSIALFWASLIGAVVAYLLPVFVTPSFGEAGVLLVIAALFLSAVPLAFALRDQQFAGHRKTSTLRAGEAPPRQGRVAAPLLAALSGAAYIGVIMGAISSFVASIATANGIDSQSVGLFVALGLILTLAGTLVPSLIKSRVSSIGMIGLATACTILSFPGLLSGSIWKFSIGFSAFAFFATIGYVYFLGLIRSLDLTDRIYIAFPAMDAGAFAASAAIAGALLTRSTPLALLSVSAAILALCWIGAAIACWIASRLTAMAPTD